MKNVLLASALVVGLVGAANARHEYESYQVTDPCCNTDCYNMQGDPRAMAPGSNYHGADTGMVHTHKGPAMIHKGQSMMEHPESMAKGTMMHHKDMPKHKMMHHGDMYKHKMMK